jgi:hypothetical protein
VPWAGERARVARYAIWVYSPGTPRKCARAGRYWAPRAPDYAPVLPKPLRPRADAPGTIASAQTGRRGLAGSTIS